MPPCMSSWAGTGAPLRVGAPYVGTAATFIFKLAGNGGAPQRFDSSGANELYQYADPGSRPLWGGNDDLSMGLLAVLSEQPAVATRTPTPPRPTRCVVAASTPGVRPRPVNLPKIIVRAGQNDRPTMPVVH